MKPIKPYKVVPFTDQELADILAIREAYNRQHKIDPEPGALTRNLVARQKVIAAAKFIVDNFPIGSNFVLNGCDTLVVKQVTQPRPAHKDGEAMGITLLLIVKDKGVPAKVEHIHLTVEFLIEYTKDWPRDEQ